MRSRPGCRRRQLVGVVVEAAHHVGRGHRLVVARHQHRTGDRQDPGQELRGERDDPVGRRLAARGPQLQGDIGGVRPVRRRVGVGEGLLEWRVVEPEGRSDLVRADHGGGMVPDPGDTVVVAGQAHLPGFGGQHSVAAHETPGRAQLVGVLRQDQVAPGSVATGEGNHGVDPVHGGTGGCVDLGDPGRRFPVGAGQRSQQPVPAERLELGRGGFECRDPLTQGGSGRYGACRGSQTMAPPALSADRSLTPRR